MALTESDIKIIIAAELKKQSFDKAEKAASRLGKSFDRLAGRIGAALSIAAIAKFSKAAITAFAEDEKAAKSLTRTYENLGLAFQGAIVNDYVDQLQRATGVADNELRPALATLTRATLDYGRAQDLLGTAMNVSAGTGLSLETVSNALAKAQLGQMSSLAKLNIGIGKAEASTISFDDALVRINQRFSGQAAIAANSYEGQLKRLRIQADEAQESLGKDLVLAISRLTTGGDLTTLGNKFEDMADNAGKMAIGIADIIGELNRDVSATGANGWITKFNDLMANLNVFEYLKNRGQDITLGVKQRTLGAPGAELMAKQNAKLLAAEKAELARIVALEKARAKEQAKQKRLREISKMLSEKESKFELQRIQLAAAAQGKLTEEEKKRVAEMQLIEEIKAAVAADDLTRAESLLKRLEEVQTLTFDLSESLLDLKAGDPFSEWGPYFTNANKMINDLFANFKAQQALLDSLTKSIADSRAAANQAVLAAKTDKATAYAQAAQASGTSAAIATQQAADAIQAATNAIASATTPEEKTAAEEFLAAANASLEAANLLTESVSAADLATALAEGQLANEFLNQSIEAATGLGLVPDVTINVTVEGSVVTAEDLAETITDIQYQYQRAGKGVLFSSIAI
jgi:hypothetical protein